MSHYHRRTVLERFFDDLNRELFDGRIAPCAVRRAPYLTRRHGCDGPYEPSRHQILIQAGLRPRAERRGSEVYGQCLRADPFGNVLTSIRDVDLTGAPLEVTVAGRRARVVLTYGDGRPGELLALVGSGGRLEISVREGNAAQLLRFQRGAAVVARIS